MNKIKYFKIIKDSKFAKKTQRKRELMERRRKRKAIKKKEPARGRKFTRGDIITLSF
jgi:hypothetical protein